MKQNDNPSRSDIADLINRNAELEDECYQASCRRNELGRERNLWQIKRDSLLKQRDWLLNDKKELISRNAELAHTTDDLHSQMEALNHSLFPDLPGAPPQNRNAPPHEAQAVGNGDTTQTVPGAPPHAAQAVGNGDTTQTVPGAPPQNRKRKAPPREAQAVGNGDTDTTQTVKTVTQITVVPTQSEIPTQSEQRDAIPSQQLQSFGKRRTSDRTVKTPIWMKDFE